MCDSLCLGRDQNRVNSHQYFKCKNITILLWAQGRGLTQRPSQSRVRGLAGLVIRVGFRHHTIFYTCMFSHSFWYIIVSYWTWGFTSTVTQGHCLTCRFGIPQYPFVYKTSELQEMAGIVSWETSPRIWINQSRHSFSLQHGDILFLLFSGPTGTQVYPGTRPDLSLAQSTDVLETRVKAGHICISPTAALLCGLLFSSQEQAYLNYVSEMGSIVNLSWLDNMHKNIFIAWKQIISRGSLNVGWIFWDSPVAHIPVW